MDTAINILGDKKTLLESASAIDQAYFRFCTSSSIANAFRIERIAVKMNLDAAEESDKEVKDALLLSLSRGSDLDMQQAMDIKGGFSDSSRSLVFTLP